MEKCTCFLLVVIFANTNSLLYKPNINHKSVNLALQTVLEFNHKDKEADIKLLDNIQHVITEIRTVIDKNNAISKVKNFRRNSRDETLTDFIQEAVIILNTYEDAAFEEFISILNKEIRNYNYRGCKFYEVMKNNEIEKFISSKFDSIRDKSTRFKKAAIIALSDRLKYKNNDNNVKELVDYINSLYRQAGDKFHKVLSDLEGYGKLKSRKPKTDLVKIIKNGLRSIIFDHYTNLSMNERRLLKRKIETLWKRYRNNLPPRSNIANMKPFNTKNSRKNINKAKNLEPDPTKYKIYTNTKKTKLNKIKMKHFKHENEESEHNNIKNTKKRYLKHTNEDTIDEPRDIQEKKAKQTLQDELNVKVRSVIKHPNDISTLSASLESIEPNEELQHKTSGQKVNLKKVAKKSEVNENLNETTSTPINNTTNKKLIWIEESTGRLPQAVLDKLANKSRNHSKSNLNLGRELNESNHKYKRSKVHSRRRGTLHRPEFRKTRRKAYEVGYDKVHGKKYYLKNQGLRNKYSDPKYAHETNLEPEFEKTYENINEQYNKNAYDSNYESQYEKTTEKVYATKNEKTRQKIYESDYHKVVDKAYESENERTHGKVYDGQHYKPHGGFQEKRQIFNRKDLEKPQYNKRQKPLGIEKRNNRLTRSTTKQLLQMLDVQVPKETGKANKSMARRTVATSNLPGPTRNPQGNEKDVLEITEQNLPSPVSVIIKERPLNEVKNEVSSNAEEVNKVKHRFVAKSNIVKPKLPKEIVTMSALDKNQLVNDNYNRLEIEEHEEFEDLETLTTPEANKPEYEKEFHGNEILKQDKENMAGAAYKNKGPLLNYNRDKEREIRTDIKFRPESPIDYKVRQNKFQITGVSVDKKDFPFDEHKDSKINLSETGFRSGIEVSAIDNNVTPDETNQPKTSENKTHSLIQHIVDKDTKNKENVTKTDGKSKDLFIPVTDMIPNDNQDDQNEIKVKETADSKRNFIAGPGTDVDSIKNNTDNSIKSKTILRLDVNRDFQVTQNDLIVPGAADNEIEPIKENNNVKDIDFTINDLGNVFEKANKFEARFHKPDLQEKFDNIEDTIKKRDSIETPDIISQFQDVWHDKNYNTNMENGVMLRSETRNLANKTDHIVTETAHKITNVNEKESKVKKEIVDNYDRIYQVNAETSMNGDIQKEENHIKSTKQQDIVKQDINFIKINTVTLEEKYKQITDVIETTDQNLVNNNVDVATKDTTIIDKNLYSTVTPIKSTESTTTRVNTTTAITVPVSIPIVTSSKITGSGTWIPGILSR